MMNSGRFSRCFIALGVLVAVLLSAQPAAASKAPPPQPDAAYVFLRYCPEINQQENDRYRLCEAFMRDALKYTPDAVIFLRKRINDLGGNMRANSRRTYDYYFYVSLTILTLAFVAGVVLVVRQQSKARTIVLGVVAILVAAGSSFGWLNQFQAEFQGFMRLQALRDEIDVKLVYAAQSGTDIDKSDINAWTKSYQEIVAGYAKAYAEGFKLPTANIVPGS